MDDFLFNYISLYAFINSTIYGNKNFITFKELEDYYQFIIDNINKKAESDGREDIYYEANIKPNQVQTFANKFSSLFTVKYIQELFVRIKNKISLKKGITFENIIIEADDLANRTKGMDYTQMLVRIHECNLDGLQILHATKMQKQLEAYLGIESKLEQLYEDNQNDETKIETYLRITTSFLSQISSLEDDLSLPTLTVLTNKIELA